MADPTVTRIPQETLWSKEFILLCLINFMVFLNHMMLLSAFPFVIGRLGGSEAVAGVSMALFCLIAVLCRPFIGHAVDSIGRKLILLAGLAGTALLTAGYGLFPLLSVVFILRLFQGAFLACSNTSASTLVSDTIPKQRFAEGMGMFGLSTALATAAAPALGLILMERLGDGAMFTAAAAVVVMALILSIGIRPQKSVAVKRPIDWKNLIDRNALPASSALLLFLMSVGAIEAFIAKFAAATGLPGGGVFFAVMAAVTLLSRLLTGRLADQRGEGIFVYSGNIAMAGALLLLAFLPGPVTYILAAVCSGYGFGGITPALQAMAVHTASPERRGAANSTFLCSYDIGIGLGAGLAGLLITRCGYNAMFAVLAFACLASALCYTFWGRKHRSSFTKGNNNKGSAI